MKKLVAGVLGATLLASPLAVYIGVMFSRDGLKGALFVAVGTLCVGVIMLGTALVMYAVEPEEKR